LREVKLVIFGLTISSSWGNGHATVWRGLCRELARLGHRVVFFEKNVAYYAAHRDFHEIPGGKLILYDSWTDAFSQALQHLADAEVAIVTSYCPDGIAAAELVLASRPLKVFYDLDTPVTLSQIEAGHSVAYIGAAGLRDFDIVLSFTGGRALSELRHRLGAKRAVALYGSVDPDVHRRVAARESYCADLSYIGTYAEDRQATLNALFLEPARRLPARRFLIAGAQYPPAFAWVPNLFFVRHIAPPDHPALYSSSRLTLNVTRRAMAQAGYCPSGRLFEAAACGTPIVTDRWDGLETFFQPGEEILVARQTEDVLAALELSDEQLTRIARRARQRAIEEHCARRRARQLEVILESVAANDPKPLGDAAEDCPIMRGEA
jgi:spore maturation protein CgeB